MTEYNSLLSTLSHQLHNFEKGYEIYCLYVCTDNTHVGQVTHW